ncbi:hypothetical protein [Streptosporangium sandarakinum]|uniref:hypothetical protein n=1 Tax=Streptosporangium sandarakinum TaxID=1260955 RepID=UPI00379687BA
MSSTLRTLARSARKKGWAVGPGSISQVQDEAKSLGWIEVPIRRGDPTVTTLRPTPRDKARRNSLSAQYGMDAQPLHTDGAHLIRPPDIVILIGETPNSTPTRLWQPLRLDDGVIQVPPEEVCHGVFLVRAGTDSFFATAYTERGYRYDPGCMTPGDARARQAAAFFTEGQKDAIDHHWDQPNMILVINNALVLHGRASAHADPARELTRVSFHLGKEAP